MAIYAQNYNPQTYLDTDIIHCTFAENVDAAGAASSVYSVDSGTIVWTMNSIYADGQGRNLDTDAGDILSLGANISDDSTFTIMSISGVPDWVTILNDESDRTNAEFELGPLAPHGGSTAVHPLLFPNPAIDLAFSTWSGTDQRDVIRDASPDSGAFEYGVEQRFVINEVLSNDGTNNFIEFYVPRDAVSIDLAGFELYIYESVYKFANPGTNNYLRHTFATTNSTLIPGSGIIVSESDMPAISNVVVTVLNGAASLELGYRSVLVVNDNLGRTVLERSYNGNFVDLGDVSQYLSVPAGESITLSPQFSGFAYIPHSLAGTGALSSPGADSASKLFGAENSSPVALDDMVVIGEDELKLIDVLANDLDADGTDIAVVTGLPVLDSDITSLGAPYSVATNLLTQYGDGVWYDPRTTNSIQRLTANEEL